MSQHPLLDLAVDREVRQAKGFRKVAEGLSGEGLAEQYAQEKQSAPQRAQAGKRYLQPHGGKPADERKKSKDVEHLAAALVAWCNDQADGMPLPDDEGRVSFLDYAVPLKSAAADRSLGDADPNRSVERVDLIGTGPDDRLVLGFIKYLEPSATRGGTGDTPLRALLYALAHTAIAEANHEDLAGELESAHGKRPADGAPVLLVIGSPRYWEIARRREAQKGAAWIRQLERLVPEIQEATGVTIHFLGLELEGDPGWTYGEAGPVLESRPFLKRAWEYGAGKLKPRARPKAKAAIEEEQEVEPDLSRPPRAYGISESYQAGDRIEHPTLGLGVVQRPTGRGKIQVLFGENLSLLVHERVRPA